MIAVWPEELRQFERESWQLQEVDARRKRQSDAGPPSYRRRFSAVSRNVSLSIILSRNEKAIFDRFYREDCSEGSRLFYMPDPSTDGWPLLTAAGVPLLTSSGLPILLGKRWLCAWGDSLPVETIDGHVNFRKEFQVVVMP